MKHPDRKSAPLKYQEMWFEIQDIIRSGKPGDQIESERVLCERFGVARETLRRTLASLERDGYLVRRQGAGTFIAEPKISQELRVRSFTNEMTSRGMTSSSKVLTNERMRAGARLSKKLAMSPDEWVLVVERLRLAEGEPMALESASIPEAIVPGLNVKALEHGSLYQILRERFNITPAGGSLTIESTVTDEAESEALNVPLLSPALLMEQITWTESGQRVEAVRSLYRSDRYQFETRITLLSGAQAFSTQIET